MVYDLKLIEPMQKASSGLGSAHSARKQTSSWRFCTWCSSSGSTLEETTSSTSFDRMSGSRPLTSCPCLRSVHAVREPFPQTGAVNINSMFVALLSGRSHSSWPEAQHCSRCPFHQCLVIRCVDVHVLSPSHLSSNCPPWRGFPGRGHFFYRGQVEDSATAEISRSQVGWRHAFAVESPRQRQSTNLGRVAGGGFTKPGVRTRT